MESLTLECGCEVELTQTWQYGCAGDCHPGRYVSDGGRITRPCEDHGGQEE